MPKPWNIKAPVHKLRIGIHEVEITSFSLRKNDSGKVLLDKQGNPTHIEVKFTNERGASITKNFSLGKSSMWVLENLSNAIKVKLTGDVEYDVETDIIGKKLFILVHQVRLTKNGVTIPDESGEFNKYLEVAPEFWIIGKTAPKVEGSDNQENPTGKYLSYRESWIRS